MSGKNLNITLDSSNDEAPGPDKLEKHFTLGIDKTISPVVQPKFHTEESMQVLDSSLEVSRGIKKVPPTPLPVKEDEKKVKKWSKRKRNLRLAIGTFGVFQAATFYYVPNILKLFMGFLYIVFFATVFMPAPIPYRWDIKFLICQGWSFSQWMSIAKTEGFRLHPVFWHRTIFITITSLINSMSLFPSEEKKYPTAKIDASEIKNTPIFILGHFRSGTSLLHELLVKDDNNIAPTVYQVFQPKAFLSRQDYLNESFGNIKIRRPMDSMKIKLNSPQEDEFALLNLTGISPYMASIFPLSKYQYIDYLGMREEDVPPKERTTWKNAMIFFFKKCLFLNQDKRIISKSPPHTARIKIIREVFPNAKFIHISRDPKTIFKSTTRLYKHLCVQWLLQRPPWYTKGSGENEEEWISNYILNFFKKMYDYYLDDVEELGLTEDDLLEIRFEELVTKPTEVIGGIYKRFNLPDWEQVKPKIQEHEEKQAAFKMNRHDDLDPEIVKRIDTEWARYSKHFKYE